MSIKIERLRPLHIGANNIVVCQRVQTDLRQISERISEDVISSRNVHRLEVNKIYAFRTKEKEWRRCMLKFVRRSDNVQVLQLIDTPGVFDVCEYTVVREIRNRDVNNTPFGLIKVMIYGVRSEPSQELNLIFGGCIQNQEVECIFGWIPEESTNRIHHAYAGDFLFEFRNKLHSFREVLIREKVVRPACVELDLNERLFIARLNRMAVHNSIHTGASIAIPRPLQNQNVPVVLAGRFEIFNLIGEGTFGAVSRGRDTLTNQVVAVKQFKDEIFGLDAVDQNNLNLNEAAILSKLHHINVINLIDTVNENDVFALVFPFMEYDLLSEIERTTYDKSRCKEIMCMVFSGLEHIHSMKVMHRDLKPQNILVQADGCIKICDFGLAIVYEDNALYSGVCGTKPYMATEIFLDYGYNHTVDIWATGCILAEIKLRRRLVVGPHYHERNIFHVFGTPDDWPVNDWNRDYGNLPSHLDEIFDNDGEFLNVLKKIMKFNPLQRPSAADALLILQKEF